MALDLEAIAVATVIGAVASVSAERILGRPFDRGFFRLQRMLGRAGGGTRTLSGIWHTRYTYESSRQAGRFEDEYLVVLRQGRNGVRGRSLKRPEGSELNLDLKVDHSVVSGTWDEYTPGQRRMYHGTSQLVLNAPGDHLEGKWLGFRSDDLIGVGPWQWQRLDNRTGRKARKRYRERHVLAWHRPVEG